MKKGALSGLFAGILLLSGLILLVLHRAELIRFFDLLRGVDPFWLLMALLLQVCTYVSLALVWYRGFHYSGVHYPLLQLIPLAVAKLFADQALPSGGISGIAFIVNSFRQRNVSGKQGMGVMLLGILSNYIAYVLVAAAAFFMFWSYHDLKSWMVLLGGIFLVVSVSIPVVVLLLNRLGDHRQLPDFMTRLPYLANMLKTYAGVPDDLVRRPLPLIEASLFQIAVFLLDSATLWAMLQAVGSHATMAVAFPSFVVASIVALLSLIPLGLGSFEVTAVALLFMLGVPVDRALTATLLLRGFTLWLPLIPGVVLARRELH